jgi:hypothetical protein
MARLSFQPARKERVPLILGMVGPSGGGKTYSALRVATGIQAVLGGEILGIDTERRRMLYYANKFKFRHAQFDPPFSSRDYMTGLQEAVSLGGPGHKTVIVDSTSHEHEGEGGYLASHEAELQRITRGDESKRQKMNFLAWVKPAAERRALINWLLRQDASFIFCFRAKEKLKLVPGKDPVPLGWQAIGGEEFVYEMAAQCVLPPNAEGIPDWSPETLKHQPRKMTEDLRAIFRLGRQLDEQVGRELATWALGDAKGAAPQPSAGDGSVDHLRTLGASAANMGTAMLQKFWKDLGATGQKAVGGAPQLAAWKEVAVQADRDAADAAEADRQPPASTEGGQP